MTTTELLNTPWLIFDVMTYIIATILDIRRTVGLTSSGKGYIVGKKHIEVEPSMNIALCDDNPAFLRQLRNAIMNACAERDWPCSCRCYSAPLDLLSADLLSTQVLFLDVDMPGINGLETAQLLRKAYRDLIIVFVTGFIEYAPAGYDVAAFRYLLKQELDTKLTQCLRDVWDRLYTSHETVRIHLLDHDAKIRVSDILYLEGTSQRHTLLHTKSDHASPLECRGTLAEYESQLSGKGFLRIQRSYLVNMAHIEDIRNYNAILDNEKTLRVSRTSYRKICEQFVLWEGEHL